MSSDKENPKTPILSPDPSSTVKAKKAPGSSGVQRSHAKILALRQIVKRTSDRRQSKTTISPKRHKAESPPGKGDRKDVGLVKKGCCNTVLPDFHHVIWPMLKGIGFKYTSTSGYSHPQIKSNFENGHGMQNYLCNHGIPFRELLPRNDRKLLETYVKYAHVDRENLTSARYNLGSLDLTHEILSDYEIQQILPLLGFEYSDIASPTRKKIILAPGASDIESHLLRKGVHYFHSLEDVRVYIRSKAILAVDNPYHKTTRSRKDATINDLRSQERLWVRIWAAESQSPLPKFVPEKNIDFSPLAAEKSPTKVDGIKNSLSTRRVASLLADRHDDDSDEEEEEESPPQDDGAKKLLSTPRVASLPADRHDVDDSDSSDDEEDFRGKTRESSRKGKSTKSSLHVAFQEVYEDDRKLAAIKKRSSEKKEAKRGSALTDSVVYQPETDNEKEQGSNEEEQLGPNDELMLARLDYRALRTEVLIQRQLREESRKRIGLLKLTEQSIPVAPREGFLFARLKLQKELQSLRFENEILQEQPDIWDESLDRLEEMELKKHGRESMQC